MDIQTERERNPTVRNIERDAPETQVDTELFENQAGLKTAQKSGIHTFYEDDSDEPEKPAKPKESENDTEESDDTETDSGTDTGATPKHNEPAHSTKRMGRAKKNTKSSMKTEDDEQADEQEDDSGGEAHEPVIFDDVPDSDISDSEDILTDSGDIPETEIAPEHPDTPAKPEQNRRRSRSPTLDQLQRKKYITAGLNSEGSAAIEMEQAVTGAVDTVVQTGGTIRTAVKSTADGIGTIHTMVKQGVKLGTARDVGKVAANIGGGIKTGMADAMKQTGTSLLKTKIDKSTTTDTGTEAIKQGLTEARYVDNARKAVQNTARGSIKTARAVKNMPRETRAQMQRIKKNAQKAKQAAQKSADVIRKVLSTKAGRIIALAALVLFLVIFLMNGLLTTVITAIASMFSWMFPDGDTSDTTVQNNIQTYLSQIQTIEAEKQAEIDGIVNSLEPEYRYDGSQITGLNKFGNSTLQPYDDAAVLAVLAVQKFHTVQDTNSADFHFTDDEIRTALEQFYSFSYRYEYDYCPNSNCSKDKDCLLSLASNSFQISNTTYHADTDSYSVTMTGPTYTHASSLYTRLEIYMNGGGTIGGSGWATVGGGTWSKTYNIGSEGYGKIDWNRFYLTVDTVYCNNPNHKYLRGQVVNYTESSVLMKAGFTADEKELYQIYLEQIRAMGG